MVSTEAATQLPRDAFQSFERRAVTKGVLFMHVSGIGFSECGGQTPRGIDRWADRRGYQLGAAYRTPQRGKGRRILGL